MRIGFNALALTPGVGRGGVANYIYQVARALPGVAAGSGSSERRPSFLVYVRDDYHELDDIASEDVSLQRVALPSRPASLRFPARVLFEQILLAFVARRDALDLLHFPDHVGATVCPPSCAMTVTIHDLTIFSHPETHSPRTRVYMERFLPQTVRKMDFIVCDSRSTERDLQARFPETIGKTTVILLAAAEQYQPDAAASSAPHLAARGVVPDNYLLYLATVEPRKNVDGILRAYAQAQALTSCPPLVIAGKIGRYSDYIRALPAELGIADKVIFWGMASNEEAVALYRGATAFLYPSWYEGFGLPVLEAMASGAPVITSTLSSLPEVAGDAAIMVNPHDPQQLRDAIITVVAQPNLRSAMRAASLARASLFSWHRCAEDLLAVWTSTVAGRATRKQGS